MQGNVHSKIGLLERFPQTSIVAAVTLGGESRVKSEASHAHASPPKHAIPSQSSAHRSPTISEVAGALHSALFLYLASGFCSNEEVADTYTGITRRKACLTSIVT